MNPFKKLKAYLRLRHAVQLADTAHQTDGARYYVLPTADGKLVVLDRRNFRELRKKHYIDRDVNVHDLLTECFYYTPRRDGTGEIPPPIAKLKRQQYYAWFSKV